MVRRQRYDVLYLVPASSILGHLRDLLLVRLTYRRVPRIVAHVRTGNFDRVLERRWLAALSRRFVDAVDRFVFLSEELSTRASSRIPDEKRTVIHNPIDPGVRFGHEEVVEKIRQRSQRTSFCIVYLSSMYESKGYRDLARALALLPKGADFHAVFAGAWPSDSDRRRFQLLLEGLPITSRVSVRGLVTDRGAVKELLREADVFVLPTYYAAEAQPRSIIEALNAATPVIATPHASIPEYVFDGENGYIVPPQNPEAIAQGIERLMDWRVWKRLAEGARVSYDRSFSPTVLAEKLRSLVL